MTTTAKRPEERLRVADVEDDGTIRLEMTGRGRTYATTIPADDSVTMIEAAALTGTTRSTIYNWAKPATSRSYSWRTPGVPLKVADGRVELPELRRYLNSLGRWWLTEHPKAARIANHGPVRDSDK